MFVHQPLILPGATKHNNIFVISQTIQILIFILLKKSIIFLLSHNHGLPWTFVQSGTPIYRDATSVHWHYSSLGGLSTFLANEVILLIWLTPTMVKCNSFWYLYQGLKFTVPYYIDTLKSLVQLHSHITRCWRGLWYAVLSKNAFPPFIEYVGSTLIRTL